ncbi:hypothetical protein LCGC14_1690580 [marine sediment metagenome]|uniref:Rubrerythrin diiron-binding domain-containing protein n=1 Tax=marine sediment metagenome TaxID=412755 RepID=A0A0F9K1D2_9ZZZZ
MTDILGAFEVFKVAEKIEINGAEFYSKQAQIAKNEEASKLFKRLEKAEIGHRKKFHQMHGDISPEERKLKNFSGDQSSYLEALADENVFVLREIGDYSNFNVNESVYANVNESVYAAIQVEQASIDLYEAIKPVVEKRHRKYVSAIAEQEYGHKKALLNLAKHLLKK